MGAKGGDEIVDLVRGALPRELGQKVQHVSHVVDQFIITCSSEVRHQSGDHLLGLCIFPVTNTVCFEFKRLINEVEAAAAAADATGTNLRSESLDLVMTPDVGVHLSASAMPRSPATA